MIINVIKQIVKHIQAKISPVSYLRGCGVNVGERCKIYSLHPGALGSEPYLVTIGNDVIITAGVRIITHDGSTFLFRKSKPKIDVMGPVHIGDNTFIGMNSVIMPGVSIGKNCVVGAMSLVTRPIPDNSVVAGNPAKFITTTADFEQKLSMKSSGTGELSYEEKKSILLKMEERTDEVGRVWKVRKH